MWKHLAIVLFGGIGLARIEAADPAWWSAAPTRIIDPIATRNNRGPVNLGQLKHVAQQAKKHLDASIPAGAGAQVNALIASFQDNPSDNYAIANLGQLKAVAKPFYDQLNLLGFDTKANLIARGYPANWAHNYPWDPSTPKAENFSTANLGQLKLVFSFDLSGTGVDTDGDGIPDVLEGSGDTDGDGMLDKEDTDSDNDGVSDAEEIANGTNPKDRDTDDDGLTEASERTLGRNPLKKDHPSVHLSTQGFTSP